MTAIDKENCFPAGTRVKAQEGWRSIESISAGELVWTHQGRLRRVVGLQTRSHVGRLKGIKLQGQSTLVWVTPDHRFLSPSPPAERGKGGEVGVNPTPTPFPSPQAGRGDIYRRLGGSAPHLATLARELRQGATPAESVLWEKLRDRRLGGAKFRRQHPLGPNYIVDFYCSEFQLAIELDGSVHESRRAQWSDGIRQRQIQLAGVRILRFRNERVLGDLERLLNEIAEHLGRTPSAEVWVRAEILYIGSQLVLDETGAVAIIDAVEDRFADEVVYDLTVEEDHSFVTEAGIAHNCGNEP
jgi:very-short-patch-repair endonuclease